MSFLTRMKEDYHSDHFFLFLGNFQFLLQLDDGVTVTGLCKNENNLLISWLVGADLTHHHHHFPFLVVTITFTCSC